MPTATSPIDSLPPILVGCGDDPLAPAPWIERGWVVATDGRMIVRASVDAFRMEVLRMLRTPARPRAVLAHFERWRPDGRTLPLPPGHGSSVRCPRCQGRPPADGETCPTCDGEGHVPDRRRVRLAPGIHLAAYRVAMLAAAGVREVMPGDGPGSPLRFAVGVAEGLVMPLVEEVR